MKTLGVMAHTAKARAPEVLRTLADKARLLGLELRAETATAALVPGVIVPDASGFEDVDAVIALGGDGTMLRAVRQFGNRDVPFIGVNIGSLGFLTSVAEADLDRALECLANDEVVSSRRSLAECRVLRGDEEVGRYAALNDVVLTSGGMSTRIVALSVTLDGDPVARYLCDGLIVSTPTGSTGHNLSAGGPILIPESRAFVISLICPHTLSSRPLVVPDSSDISIQSAGSGATGVKVTVDGQVGQTLQDGECVRVRASPNAVRFLHLPGYSYFRVMSQKLGWKGSTVR